MKTLPRNQILIGDAAAVLADLLPEQRRLRRDQPAVRRGLRDYGHPGQLGSRSQVEEYVRNLRRRDGRCGAC